MLYLIYASSADLVQFPTALQVIHYHACLKMRSQSQTLGKFPNVTQVLNNPAEI